MILLDVNTVADTKLACPTIYKGMHLKLDYRLC